MSTPRDARSLVLELFQPADQAAVIREAERLGIGTDDPLWLLIQTNALVARKMWAAVVAAEKRIRAVADTCNGNEAAAQIGAASQEAVAQIYGVVERMADYTAKVFAWQTAQLEERVNIIVAGAVAEIAQGAAEPVAEVVRGSMSRGIRQTLEAIHQEQRATAKQLQSAASNVERSIAHHARWVMSREQIKAWVISMAIMCVVAWGGWEISGHHAYGIGHQNGVNEQYGNDIYIAQHAPAHWRLCVQTDGRCRR